MPFLPSRCLLLREKSQLKAVDPQREARAGVPEQALQSSAQRRGSPGGSLDAGTRASPPPNLAVRGRDRAQGRWGTGLREEGSLEAEAEGLKRRPELREGDRQRPQQAGGRPRARSSWDVTQWTDAGLQDTRG